MWSSERELLDMLLAKYDIFQKITERIRLWTKSFAKKIIGCKSANIPRARTSDSLLDCQGLQAWLLKRQGLGV